MGLFYLIEMKERSSGNTVLVVGSGGREHAIGCKIKQSALGRKLYFAPGNAGTEKLGENIPIGAEEINRLAAFAADNRIGLTIVGPEGPLAKGIRNEFDEDRLALFGVRQEASRLEASKAWAAGFEERHKIPHPETQIFKKVKDALNFVEFTDPEKYVIKTDGLCAGKGVVLPKSVDEARNTVKDMMVNKTDVYGEAGRIIVVQERLVGREVSVIGITDGKVIRYLAPAVDHKALYTGGPNTGGMGAYAPDPLTGKDLMKIIHRDIMQAAVDGMRVEGCPYEGVLFAGLMITKDGRPQVLEFNVRFGDPETEAQVMLMKNDLMPVLESSRHGTLSKRRIVHKRGAAVGVMLVSDGYPGKYEKEKEVRGLTSDFGGDVEIFHGGTKTVNGQTVTDGGRVACITAFGEDVLAASEKVYKIIENGGIFFEGARYRPDIGGGK